VPSPAEAAAAAMPPDPARAERRAQIASISRTTFIVAASVTGLATLFTIYSKHMANQNDKLERTQGHYDTLECDGTPPPELARTCTWNSRTSAAFWVVAGAGAVTLGSFMSWMFYRDSGTHDHIAIAPVVTKSSGGAAFSFDW
jgi:hypothetical protein